MTVTLLFTRVRTYERENVETRRLKRATYFLDDSRDNLCRNTIVRIEKWSNIKNVLRRNWPSSDISMMIQIMSNRKYSESYFKWICLYMYTWFVSKKIIDFFPRYLQCIHSQMTLNSSNLRINDSNWYALLMITRKRFWYYMECWSQRYWESWKVEISLSIRIYIFHFSFKSKKYQSIARDVLWTNEFQRVTLSDSHVIRSFPIMTDQSMK